MVTVTKFRYWYADGRIDTFWNELPFNLLKIKIDIHGGLVKIQKIHEVISDD